jgi:hypothetical protein
MEMQTLLALLIVLAAAAYMGRRLVRTVRGARPDADDGGCASGGCGCESGTAASRSAQTETKKGAAG